MTTTNLPKAYHRTRIILGITGALVGWVYLALLAWAPLGEWVVAKAGHAGRPYVSFLLFMFFVGLIGQVYSFPMSVYLGYIHEHRYGLSNQTLPAWAWEKLKAMLVGLVIGLPIMLIFYACLRRFGPEWWLPVGLVILLFSVVLGRLAPVLIFPLFYRFEPLDEGDPLAGNIHKLAASQGLSVSGVYRFNMSKTTRKANAAFTGLGKTRRVILADTLLDSCSEAEILAVVAHELGHFRLKHIWKGMALGIATTMVGLYLVSRGHVWLAGEQVAALAHLPWLALLLGWYGVVTAPLGSYVSRRYEFAADRFAAKLIGTGKNLANALEKLNEMNLGDPEPHPLVEWYSHSHPSLKRRLAALDTTGG